MGVKVAKFGGSSVADVIQIKKMKEIIQGDPDIRYVIVSAPGKRFDEDNKITDLLYLCHTHKEHKLPYEQLLQVVHDRFTVTAVNLGATVDFSQDFDDIKDALEKGCSSDYMASRGEYLNAKLIAAYLGFDFVDSAQLIVFDEKGKLLDEETNEALSSELKKHDYAVIPGFYGTVKGGDDIKTFTRGGSDITGSIVARAVDADVYENWTDVSGFLMADPRIVDNPKPIHEISYKELRELSYMGASVLHEDAIHPARIANIPINIKNTNFPNDPGTVIKAHHEDKEYNDIITGIAGKKDFTVIAIYKNMMVRERGYVRRILGILEDFDCNFEHIPSGIDTVSVVVSNKDLDGRLDELMEAFTKQLEPDNIECFENMSLIATVGYGMNRRKGVAAKLLSALADADINLRMIEQGSSEINIIVGVENKDFEPAIRAIYNAFA
ncbi:MAG: aspartate kinase [Firmicutes bacterium]|nr:aspartate kinase [Bacillota bacterium]